MNEGIGNLAGGVVGLIVVVLGIALTLYWLLFPVFVYSQLVAIRKQLEQLNRLTSSQAKISESSSTIANTYAQQTADNTGKLATFFDGRNVKIDPSSNEAR